jgi:uncharacterized protein
MSATVILTIIVIGIMAGILSGLIGVGGGIILVPALVYFLKYDQLQAQGSSLGVLTLPVVVFAFLHYYNSSKGTVHPIDLKVIGFLAIGFVAGSLIGSTIAFKIDQNVIKKIFAIVLFYIAFKMLHWDTAIINFFKQLV